MASPSLFEISNEQYFTAEYAAAGSLASQYFFIAPVKCQVQNIKELHSTAGDHGSAVTATVRRCQGTEAVTAGDDLLATTKIDLKAAAATVQAPDLTATTADLTLAAGDRLALHVTGNTQTLAGVLVSVTLKRI